jgi:pyruvate/2-oxoglutarate dehydrogenase complex dihydrolipoamide dehydrogenase (E3) component
VNSGTVRLHYRERGETHAKDTEVVLLAVGWVGNLEGLGLDAAGIQPEGGYIKVDDQLRTSVPNVYAAGDVIGHMMLVQTAEVAARFAAENAVAAARAERPAGLGESGVRGQWPLRVVPHGGFTDPEYGSVGLTEAEAQVTAGGCVVAVVRYADLERAVIDRHSDGFAKLVVSRSTRRILGAHVVGEQAVEVVQLAAATMAAEQPVERLAGLQPSRPSRPSSAWPRARPPGDSASPHRDDGSASWPRPGRSEVPVDRSTITSAEVLLYQQAGCHPRVSPNLSPHARKPAD